MTPNINKYTLKSAIRRGGKVIPAGESVALSDDEAKALGPKVIDFGVSADMKIVTDGAAQLVTDLQAALKQIDDLEEKLADSATKIAAFEATISEQGKQIADLIKQRDELVGKLESADKKPKK